MLSFWKNMLSNVCLSFFGVDAILAHAKAWDLVLWKCPRSFHDPSIFNFLIYTSTERLTPLNLPKCALDLCVLTCRLGYCARCLQLFFWDLFIILSLFLAGSCSVKMSQAFHDPSIKLPSRVGKVNTFKISEMRLYFDSDVWGRCLNYFCWIFSLF